jgi:hypothetical protein
MSSPSEVDAANDPDQRCYRLAVFTIGSKDIDLEYTVSGIDTALRLWIGFYPSSMVHAGSGHCIRSEDFGLAKLRVRCLRSNE